MRILSLWGSPCDGDQDNDIERFDYLFLGNYVGRGSHSLEVICLLLALNIRYPEQIHLLRGSQEDKWVNKDLGFSEECAVRLGEDPKNENSVFQRINALFEYLPFAAVVDDKVFCVHGGISPVLETVGQIKETFEDNS